MQKLIGVNLGGWLVLERWITPSLFSGLQAWDEYNFCQETNEYKLEKLKKHRETFVTKSDFNWIAQHGLNAVRIPVGYWIFGSEDPYIGGIEYLDLAMNAAGQNGLGVVVDLHAAPGSQNGWKHSGKEGKISWHKKPQNIEQTLSVIKQIAQRYKNHPSFIGIELLNEPRRDVPKDELLSYYRQAYAEVRHNCGESVAVIISDAFQPFAWQAELLPPDFQNVWLDCHLYQVFNPKDKKLNLEGHLDKVKSEWMNLIDKVQTAHPLIVGEWSAALDEKTFNGLDQQQKEQRLKEYFNAQIATFSRAQGHFYWTYKTEGQSVWNLRSMIEKGIFTF
jgi:glucan 1,3-beta-glucosidase